MRFFMLFLFGLLFNTTVCRADEAAGQRAYAGGDYAAALQAWRPLAESGDAQAELDMGLLYDTGHGVPQDFTQALSWYMRAANAGNVQATFNVGVMYDAGRGIPEDHHQAARWYRLAADHGFGRAAYNLALMYLHGDGVRKSRTKADHYFRIAADHGIAAAQSRLVETKVEVEQLPLPPQQPAPHATSLQAAVEPPLPLPPQPVPPPPAATAPAVAAAPIDPALAHAQRLILAHGLTHIDARAISALWTAARHDDPVAQYDLGFCYQNGIGVAVDRMLAFVWYRRAVNSTAPASLHDAATRQVHALEAQLDRSQLDAANAMVNTPAR